MDLFRSHIFGEFVPLPELDLGLHDFSEFLELERVRETPIDPFVPDEFALDSELYSKSLNQIFEEAISEPYTAPLNHLCGEESILNPSLNQRQRVIIWSSDLSIKEVEIKESASNLELKDHVNSRPKCLASSGEWVTVRQDPIVRKLLDAVGQNRQQNQNFRKQALTWYYDQQPEDKSFVEQMMHLIHHPKQSYANRSRIIGNSQQVSGFLLMEMRKARARLRDRFNKRRLRARGHTELDL